MNSFQALIAAGKAIENREASEGGKYYLIFDGKNFSCQSRESFKTTPKYIIKLTEFQIVNGFNSIFWNRLQNLLSATKGVTGI